MEKLSAKELLKRWFKGSFAFFGYASSILSSMSAVFGFWLVACSPQDHKLMATVFFAISIIILIGALVIGLFVAPYRIVQERDKEQEIRRLTEGIRGVIPEVINIRNQIDTYKGQPDKPYLNAYGPLNETQQADTRINSC
jgi:hypothetical protein